MDPCTPPALKERMWSTNVTEPAGVSKDPYSHPGQLAWWIQGSAALLQDSLAACRAHSSSSTRRVVRQDWAWSRERKATWLCWLKVYVGSRSS